MRTTSLVLLALGCALSVAGCGAPAPTRAVTAELRVDTSTMNHPVVIAESSDHRVFIADVTASGRFTLQLPPSVSYRMTLATATRSDGIYSAVARINWPLEAGAARWATVNAGATLDLGVVYRRGSKSSSHAGSSGGGGDDAGACHEDDHAGCQSHDSDYDCDSDHHYSGDDHCEGDGNGAQHEHDCDDDDHHKCNGDGGSSHGDGGSDDHGGGDHACDGGNAHGGSGDGGTAGGGTPGSGGGTSGSGGIN